MKLTLTNLSSEYADWIKENANGRNKQDLRFGQYIFNNYLAGWLLSFPELFYEELATKAYQIAIKHLLDQEKLRRENNEH